VGKGSSVKDGEAGGLAAQRRVRFASVAELSGNRNGIYVMADGVSDEQFEVALTAASDEGAPSRANVVRKIKGINTPVQRLVRIREMAPTGRTSGDSPRPDNP